MTTAAEFDVGPLSWVQPEIDQTLARGLDALGAFAASQQDLTALKHARNHVHQAAGAIRMVGLDAVVAYTDEMERGLARLEELPAPEAAAACATFDRAGHKLRIFLNEVVNGGPPVALVLFPEYESMQRERGVAAVAPTDLFYPDLSVRAPAGGAGEAIPADQLPLHLVRQRRTYQGGLLAFLRGDAAGARAMRAAASGIEAAMTQASLRTFWWTVGALFDAIAEGGLDVGFGVKQLAGRIDLQIRRVATGSTKVADRLRREVLYFIAISAPVTSSVRAAQQAFRLSGLIPSAEALSSDVVRLQPLLREARERLASAKDTWLKVTSGRAENLPKLKETLAAVHAVATDIGNGPLVKLTAALVAELDRMPSTGAVPELFAMEYATGMLLAETAVENYASLSREFPKQVEAMLARLDAVRSAQAEPPAAAPLLDEMSKRAQERVLLAQIGREIQANLRHMEQVLDAFFRDHGKRAELATLGRDGDQIRGALKMLGLDDAERLLGLCQTQIETYAHPETPVDDVDLELLAESLSGLGFYIEAVEQQRPDRERLIAPLLAKRLGEAPGVETPAGETVESAVEELRGALPALMAEMHRAPLDAGARDALRARLGDLRDDAKLIDDGELIEKAEDALRELETGSTAALEATVSAIAGTPTPAPALSDETQRLLTIEATGLDAELLDIYLAEAGEVLDTVAAQLGVLSGNFGDREALRTVRRQFHTLKGSGRMVGLAELGELAWNVEKIHNRLLEEERAVTPAVLALIRVAESEFRRWVADLQAAGRVAPDPERLYTAIRDVEAELPGDRESVLTPAPAPAAPDMTVEPAIEVAVPPVLEAASDVVVEPAAAPAIAASVEPAVEVVVEPALEAAIEVAVEPTLEAAIEPVAEDVVRPAAEAVELPELGSTATVGVAVVDATVVDHADLLEAIDVGPVDAVMAHEIAPVEPVAMGSFADAVVASETPMEFVSEPTEAEEALAEQSVVEATTVEATAERRAEAETSVAAENAEEPTPDTSPAADEVLIGDVSISAVLYSILVDEADQHLVTLAHELSLLESDPRHLPSAAMVRASHTLCGIHRTGGFPLVAATAKSLEQCLSGLGQLALEARASALPVIARAVQCVTHLVRRIEERGGFTAEDVADAAAVENDLETLRQQASAAPAVVVEAETEPVPETCDAEPEATLSAIDAEMEAALNEALEAQEEALAARGYVETGPEAEAVVPAIAKPEVETVSLALEPPVGELPVELAAQPEPVLADLRDEIDEQLLPIFLEEAAELFPRAGEQLRAWRRMPSDTAIANQLRRTLHTFKGSARMAGAMRLGELSHLMESRFVADDMLVTGTAELFEALDTDLDHIAYVLDALREGRCNVALPWLAAPPGTEDVPAAELESPIPAEPDASVAFVVPAVSGVAPPHVGSVDTPDASGAMPAAEPFAPVVVPLPSVGPAALSPSDAGVRPHAEPGMRAMLRVRADIIDRLANEAGEVAIARARIEGELRNLKANLLELTGSVIRLRSQVREIEIQAESQIPSGLAQAGGGAEGFDPLEFDRYTRFQELTRSLAESVNDVSTVQQALLKNFDDADAALAAQGRLTRDVQQQLFAIRTVPFGSLAERLYRILRATGKELDKRANLDIRGGQTELDRSVLEKLAGPLEHLLRNAVAHGIEPREGRSRAGKPRTGEITLTAGQSGNEIVIELTDDGAGLNLDDIRARGVAMGRFAPDARPTDAQLIECIFEPGFSTASKVTQVAGRGIGMDVVRAEISALGGRVDVATAPGRGTTFTLFLPLTLAVAQAVLVRAAGRLWALPGPMVEKVQQVTAEGLAELYAARRVEWQGESYPLHYLPRLLADAHSTPEVARHNTVLLLRAGSHLAAVHVDEMVGNQEVVVKNLGPQLARVSGIAGATVLGTGEIVLIINAVQLAQRADLPNFDETAIRAVAATEEGAPTGLRPRPLVMVVDDSLTVRKITSRLMQREGYKVVTAKDGVEALEMLESETPDAILLDIEMPRMDGFEFAKTIKGERRTAGIPIVMITSRIAEKHRNRARELGVDRYLGKPYQDEELLRNLRELLAVTA